MGKRTVGREEAERIGAWLGVDWAQVDPDQFRRGMEVEFEHGSRDPATDVTHDDPVLTGKIAWAHLKEFPDYYTRLDRLEAEADAYWTARKSPELRGPAGVGPLAISQPVPEGAMPRPSRSAF